MTKRFVYPNQPDKNESAASSNATPVISNPPRRSGKEESHPKWKKTIETVNPDGSRSVRVESIDPETGTKVIKTNIYPASIPEVSRTEEPNESLYMHRGKMYKDASGGLKPPGMPSRAPNMQARENPLLISGVQLKGEPEHISAPPPETPWCSKPRNKAILIGVTLVLVGILALVIGIVLSNNDTSEATNDPIQPTLPPGSGDSLVYGLQPSCHTDDRSGFNVCLDLKSVSGRYESWMDAFGTAKERWEKVITGNLPSIPTSDAPRGGEYEQYICSDYPRVIDDVYICGQDDDIDGVGHVLGAATPVWGQYLDRTNPMTGEPYVVATTGFMVFDRPDIQNLMADGTWEEVIQHESLHILGIGSLWIENGLHYEGSSVYTSNTNAEREWNAIGCNGRLPVERDGGEGTAGGHWDEDCLGHEMMTGYLSGADQPLSKITIGSLEDLGYEVDYSQADFFSMNDLNLNYCGSFCTNQLRRLVVKGHAKKPLSPSGRDAIASFAEEKLAALQKEPEEHPDGLVYIGGRSIDVLYEEDGEVHVITVTSGALNN